MKAYADATESKFGFNFHVDVFINMIRDKELSMRLREQAPKNLEAAVAFATRWLQDKKNVEDVCGPFAPQQSFRQYREPDTEPMEVDQLRFRQRRFDNKRPQRPERTPPAFSSRPSNATDTVVCFACNQTGHTGNNCHELRRCKEIIAKYRQKLDERNGKFVRSFRPTSRDNKERKF